MDPNSFFYVAATLKIVPEKLNEVIEGFTELSKLVEDNEPGCLSYQFFYSEAESEIMVFEAYTDAAAFEAHRNSEHFKAAMARNTSDLFAGPPKIQTGVRKGGFRRG